MASESIELQPSWLLHHTPYRDTSLILELFTLEHGRMALMARSARAARPAVRALYQPFRGLLISWTGGGELKTLIGIEASGRPLDLAERPLACAYYLNELVLRLLGKAQPQPELFGYYALALAELDAGAEVEGVLRAFELRLLDALGVLPDFVHATRDGSAVLPEARYRFHPGNAVAVRIDDIDGDAGWHADGMTPDEGVELSGATLHALAAIDLDADAVREEARPLMKRLLHLQLGDKPLKSRALFAALAGES